MSTRSCLSPDEGRGRDRRVARIFKHAQQIARCREKFRHRRLLRPRKARRGGGLPVQRRRGVPVVDLDEGHKVGVVAVIVLHQDAVVLQADDRDPVAEVLRKGSDAEAERGAWAHLQPRRWRLAPVKRVDGPLKLPMVIYDADSIR